MGHLARLQTLPLPHAVWGSVAGCNTPVYAHVLGFELSSGKIENVLKNTMTGLSKKK